MKRTSELFKQLSSRAAHSFITTPIFYVNAEPHIGHLYSALLADAGHRWKCLKGVQPAIFTTGTDEHGLKIQKAAALHQCEPIELCDKISQKFRGLFDSANISYTDYIRTTETRHTNKVVSVWKELQDRGFIYKGSYEGWYSVPDEAFLSSNQVEDGSQSGTKVSIDTGHILEWSSEENYLFRLTEFRDKLLEWIHSKPYPIVPESAQHQVNQYLLDLNSDLSVSRPRSRLQWGIPVPGDSSQTIYVWLDALVNYLTVSHHPSPGHTWPATEHIVGKDILRFHAVYWPAFLMAAGLELPRRIITHSHWTMGKTKMSKSKGNVVNPSQQIEKYGVDALRYFLLKEGVLQYDGDYSEERVVTLLNADLADTLGNLVQRITATKLYPRGTSGLTLPSQINGHTMLSSSEDIELMECLASLPGTVDKHYQDFDFSKGISGIMKLLYQTNQFLQRHEPWALTKDTAKYNQLELVLGIAIESVRLCSCLLYPVIPEASSSILDRIGQPYSEQQLPLLEDLECWLRDPKGVKKLENFCQNTKLGEKPLFRKL